MATSGARLQLAIAPAGSGKTTAMRALASAWTAAGGTLIGLPPSAAAAAAMRSPIDNPTDHLAKLTHSTEPGSEYGATMHAWVAGNHSTTLEVIARPRQDAGQARQ